MLQKYKVVGDEPRGLPTLQTTDHYILLQPDARPINVHPYRYPHFQKNEIECLTREMLQHGLICHSISPYSSLVLLMHKDGLWRFCVDYRALNAATIQDRFPIPTMDELIEELHGAPSSQSLTFRWGIIKPASPQTTSRRRRSEPTMGTSSLL